MDMLTQPLDADMQTEIEALYLSVSRLTTDSQEFATPGAPTLVEQAHRIMERLSGWLLDDEQKQVMASHPWQAYFLHAAAYLCDIGLMNGNDGDDHTITSHSHDWIQQHWQTLGLRDADRASIMARICMQMQDSSGPASPPATSEPIPFAGSMINIALIAACIRLAKALELKSATTFTEIVRHLPGGRKEPLKPLMDAFDVDGIGPHPYFPLPSR